jgi:transposase-like protein
MCGLEVSAGQVSRIASELDEKLSEFRPRRLDSLEYPYLLIDARYEKVRINGHVVGQAVLIVSGVNSLGFREILDWRVSDSESEDSWGELFRSLKDRGLRGLKLVVSDAHKGIRKALSRHFQGVWWQRCRVHFKRELMKKVNWKQLKQLLSDINAVLAPEEKDECLRRAEEMAIRWDSINPKVSAMLRADFESCLTVCVLPSEHRRKLNSTNMIERVMRELKRRTRVVGIFPNAASLDRLVGAQLLELNEQWQLEEKRYLAMELLDQPAYQGLWGGEAGKAAA